LLSPAPDSPEANLAEIKTFATKSLRDLPGLLKSGHVSGARMVGAGRDQDHDNAHAKC
jgi:hypothetical protein